MKDYKQTPMKRIQRKDHMNSVYDIYSVTYTRAMQDLQYQIEDDDR